MEKLQEKEKSSEEIRLDGKRGAYAGVYTKKSL